MKKLLPLLILLGGMFAAHAQDKGYGSNDTIGLPPSYPRELSLKPTVKERFHFGVTMGSSIMFAAGQDAVFSTFMAPTLSYHFTDKFRVRSGIGIQMNPQANMFSLRPLPANDYMAGSTNMLFLQPKVGAYYFVSGEYDVNDKLTLTGRVFGTHSTLQYPGLNPQTYNLNSYGAAAGFWYKPNGKSAFGAEIQISRGNDPYQRYRPGGMMGGFDGPRNPFGIWY